MPHKKFAVQVFSVVDVFDFFLLYLRRLQKFDTLLPSKIIEARSRNDVDMLALFSHTLFPVSFSYFTLDTDIALDESNNKKIAFISPYFCKNIQKLKMIATRNPEIKMWSLNEKIIVLYFLQELQSIKEQHNNHVRELEAQLERNRGTISPTKLKTELGENVELIKLKRLSKKQSAQINSLQAQIEMNNSEMNELQNNAASLKSEKGRDQVWSKRGRPDKENYEKISEKLMRDFRKDFRKFNTTQENNVR